MKDIYVDAGSLRQRVSIYQEPTGVDSLGQDLASKRGMNGWEHIGDRWALIEPNVGAPYIGSDQLRNITSHRITLRYYAGLTPRHRIVFGSRIFNVTGIINSDERKIQTVVACQEVI